MTARISLLMIAAAAVPMQAAVAQNTTPREDATTELETVTVSARYVQENLQTGQTDLSSAKLKTLSAEMRRRLAEGPRSCGRHI